MKKYFPFISFILILSFVLPFFPCFSFSAKAEDSVSSDDAFIKWEKDNVDAIRNGLAGKGTVVNPDFYLVTDDTINPNLWEIIARNYNLDYQQNVGKPLNRQIYDYTVSNNISNVDIYNDCFNTIYNDLQAYVPYSVYTVLHKSDLVNFFNPINSIGGIWLDKFNVNSLPDDSFYFMKGNTSYYRLDGNDNWGNHHFSCFRFPLDFVDSYNFYALGDTPSSLFDSNFLKNFVGVSDSQAMFNFYAVSDNGVPNSLTLDYCTYYSVGGFSDFSYNSSFNQNSGIASLPCYYYGPDYTYFLNGGFFIVPDSVNKFSFPIFHNYNSYFQFINGNSYAYNFSPDIDISKYGTDLDLDQLYDVISDSVGDAEGNIIDSINSLANNYLKDQVQLLGDIKNALNDSFGRSWLRKIHDQLALYFPQTLDSLSDLKNAFSGGSGGVADLTNIEDDLSIIKGLLILQTAHDIIDDLKNNNVHSNDFNDVVTVANTKFPFSIPNDIVTILGLFVAEPTEPEFAFPVPFSNNHETFDIDISFIGSSLPYIRGAFIILFILFLVVVSVKVINSLKE